MGLLNDDMDWSLLGASILANNSGHYGQLMPTLGAAYGDYSQANLAYQEQLKKKQEEEARKQWMAQNMTQYANAPAFVQEQAIKQRFAAPKSTSDIDNYEYYVNSEKQAGRIPLGFNAWRIQGKKAGATNIDLGLNKGNNKFFEAMGSKRAEGFDADQKAAQSAYNQNQQLSGFVTASAKGDEGGLQPIVTGAKNALSTLGFDFDSLTDTAKMQQVVGLMLGQKMVELGARGLTDKDMEILRESLPRVETSREARVAVANALRRTNNNIISGYIDRVKRQDKDFTNHNFYRLGWENEWQPAPEYITPPIAPSVNTNSVFAPQNTDINIDDLVEKYRTK